MALPVTRPIRIHDHGPGHGQDVYLPETARQSRVPLITSWAAEALRPARHRPATWSRRSVAVGLPDVDRAHGAVSRPLAETSLPSRIIPLPAVGPDHRIAGVALPERTYLICANQRSGSNLLCRALSDTGVAGHPDEDFPRRRLRCASQLDVCQAAKQVTCRARPRGYDQNSSQA
jgi:hypothetical protein